jgi:hypothetical protein
MKKLLKVKRRRDIMHDKTTKLLMKKVKKHKKWTEGVFVNPMYWEVDGTPYYMAGYTKNNESVATAYLTLGEEKFEEVLEAQPNLALFADLSNNIFNIGMDWLKIPVTYYTKPLSIPVKGADPKVHRGSEAFAQLWDTQQKFNALVKGYKDYFDNDVLIRKQLSEADVIKTQETANMVNMYQYRALRILLDHNDDIKSFAAYLENSDHWSTLNGEDQKFIKGITDNAKKMRANLAGLELIENEDFARMTQLNYDLMIEKNKKIIEGQRQYIRYPKLST